MTYDIDGPKTGGRIQRQHWRAARSKKRPGTALERYLLHRELELEALRATPVAA